MRRARGAALPETVVVLGVTLTLLFGMVELGVIGYTQLSADGAAYAAAHASVLGKDPNAAVSGPYPKIASDGTVSVQASAPDSTDVAVDYQVSNQSRRVGGVQVVRPTHSQATVTDNVSLPGGIGLALPSAPLGGAAIEGNMLVSGPGFDLNGDGLNTSNAFNNQKSYFADDGNAPPYFIGFHFIYDCMQIGSSSTTDDFGCANYQLRALGTAEYLDADNWGASGNGIGPNAVYSAMSLHYQTYANLAAQLPAAVPPLHSPGGLNPQTNPCLQQIQSWDVTPPAATSDPTAYPLHPHASNGRC